MHWCGRIAWFVLTDQKTRVFFFSVFSFSRYCLDDRTQGDISGGIRDEYFRPIENPFSVFFDRCCLGSSGIRTGIGFSQTETIEFAGDKLREKLFPLFFVTVIINRSGS